MITNPIYAGVGPYPPIVSDDQWTATGAEYIRQHGLDDYVQQVRVAPIAVNMKIPRFEDLPEDEPQTAAQHILNACRKANPNSKDGFWGYRLKNAARLFTGA